MHRLTAFRVGVLVVNLAVLVYLLTHLARKRSTVALEP